MKLILLALLVTLSVFGNSDFEHDILAFEKQDQNLGFQTQKSLFIGSSSIRMWNTKKYFPKSNILNRGFGGSEVSHILKYYNRILIKYKPKTIVLYSGENDLGHKSALAVFENFNTLIKQIVEDLPDTHITWILVKKSPARKHLNDKIDKLNSLIFRRYTSNNKIKFLDINKLLKLDTYSDYYFRSDKLHFNDEAYQIISRRVKRIHPLP